MRSTTSRIRQKKIALIGPIVKHSSAMCSKISTIHIRQIIVIYLWIILCDSNSETLIDIVNKKKN